MMSMMSGVRERIDVLLTMGGMTAPIDDVRSIVNHSSGELGVLLCHELAQKKIRAHVICGWTQHERHRELAVGNHNVVYAPTFHEMQQALRAHQSQVCCGVFAAAVLDFLPEAYKGKIESRQSQTMDLRLKSTPKLIDEFCASHPESKVVAFKLESAMSEAQIEEKALETNRGRKPSLIVCNRKEDMSEGNYKGVLLGPLESFWKDQKTSYSKKSFFSKKDLAVNLSHAIEKWVAVHV